ncbi:unnamed protein product [Trichogramma brassicae]|uniref:DUF4771 domain-containing protein n=1 Tax=Trichogramma brassicae TaxID=86971 RepID=A0A6H5HSD3_9HYME|nr:unnamed protein product [Trichogramma brassicae]
MFDPTAGGSELSDKARPRGTHHQARMEESNARRTDQGRDEAVLLATVQGPDQAALRHVQGYVKPKSNLKPYGFCCTAYDSRLMNHQRPTASQESSLASLHECPALRIRQYEYERRPDRRAAARSSSVAMLKLSTSGTGSAPEPGQQQMAKDATESELEFVRDIERRRAQMEHERRMERWAELGRSRVLRRRARQRQVPRHPYPRWYTEFSLDQLRRLHEFEDAMFKDKEEKKTFRTINGLLGMGMLDGNVARDRVNERVVHWLVQSYSKKPVKFLRELYRAVTGSDFVNEDYSTRGVARHRLYEFVDSLFYDHFFVFCHRQRTSIRATSASYCRASRSSSCRISARGCTSECRHRQRSSCRVHLPRLKLPRKRSNPLLEKPVLPVDWRNYERLWFAWRKRCQSLVRPAVLLREKAMNEKRESRLSQYRQSVEQYRRSTTAAQSTEPVEVEVKQETIAPPPPPPARREPSQLDPIRVKSEKIKSEKDAATLVAALEEMPPPYQPRGTDDFLIYSSSTGNRTKPKKELTDAEFFDELKLEQPQRCYPEGRENLSYKLQHFLLDVEADFFKMTQEANKLTSQVGQIVQDIYESGRGCDSCCPCRQARRTNLKYHATKQPFTQVQGTMGDDRKMTKIVGDITMLTPASSMSSKCQLIRVPSKDEMFKQSLVDGNVTIDGKNYPQITDVTENEIHVPARTLAPDPAYKDVKNVPPCGCGAGQQRDDDFVIGLLKKDKDKDMCYAQKYRPEETSRCKEQPVQKELSREESKSVDDREEAEAYEEQDWIDVDEEEQVIEQVEEEKKSRPVCQPCQRTLKKSICAGRGSRVANKCSCNSLSEFLQMDLRKECCKKGRDKDSAGKESSRRASSAVSGKRRKSKLDTKAESRQSARFMRAMSKRLTVDSVGREPCDERDQEEEARRQSRRREPCPEPKPIPEGGPFGCKTESEEKLPVAETVAYLVDPPPDGELPARVPVRKGGKPCKCRENRNKRPVRLCNFGDPVPIREEPEEGMQEETVRIVEELRMVTPSPSIRRDNEYIPEYELADPVRRCTCGGPDDIPPEIELKNAKKICQDLKDDKPWIEQPSVDSLTIPLKQPAGPRLKVVRPVCECRYERKVVKHREETAKLEELRRRPKNPVSMIEDVAPLGCCTGIKGIAMMTPLPTPDQSGDYLNYPRFPIKIHQVSNFLSKKAYARSDLARCHSFNKKLEARCAEMSKTSLEKEIEFMERAKLEEERDEADCECRERGGKDDTLSQLSRATSRRRKSEYYDSLEERMLESMQNEINRMSQEDEFVSVKLPEYNKMPQMLYWISYRAKGMKVSAGERKRILKLTLKSWKKQARKINPMIDIDEFELTKAERKRLNFDHAQYWKRRITRKKAKFYKELRDAVVSFGRNIWPTMQFGKFPDILFKQAYFTYFPTLEKGCHVFKQL